MFTPSKFSASVALGLAASLVACGGGGGSSSSAAAPLTLSLPSSYVLKWSDEFSNDGEPSAAWAYDLGAQLLGGSVWGNNEQEYYTQDSANVYVSAGQLTIQPVAGIPAAAQSSNVSQSYPLLATSARLKTDTPAYYSALNGTPYGFYEIRAKVPCVYGAWPAIWMMGRTGDWPDRGEIDVMEWLGRYFTGPGVDTNQVQSGMHTKNNYGEHSFYQKANLSTMCSAYHNFQMHWSASEIVIGVDGVKTFSRTKPTNAGVNDWPFDAPAYLILNVAVGGGLGVDPPGETNRRPLDTNLISSMAMKVDYVKVWQPH